MDQTLIPFALRSADGEIVGVADVASGSSCGCICPSCSTALIARKGDVKVWHFAHQSRGEIGATQTRCDFSWDVSVRLMARQILRKQFRMTLPACEGQLFDTLGSAPTYEQRTFVIARPQTIELISCRIDVSFAGTLVDALAETAQGPFVVYFTYGGRSVPDGLKAPAVPCAGVVSINIPWLAPMFSSSFDGARTPRQTLADILASDASSKNWIYHPDHAGAQERAQAEFAEQVSRRSNLRPLTYPSRVHPSGVATKRTYDLVTPTAGETPLFHCVNCEFKWGVSMGGISRCPQCGSIYMIVRIRPR